MLRRHGTRCKNRIRTRKDEHPTNLTDDMTNGTIALLSWLHASTSTNQMKAKTTASGLSTTRMRNAPRRRYEVHGERTCYRCRQTGHYARECPRAYSQQSTETKAETMKNLIRSMTLNERSQFKGFVTRAEKLRMLIKAMTTTERSEFKAYVLGKDKQQKMSTNMPSRETGPRFNSYGLKSQTRPLQTQHMLNPQY